MKHRIPPVAASASKLPTSATNRTDLPEDPLGGLLREIGAMESELEFLVERIPTLKAKLDAATRPLWEAVSRARQDMVRLLERRLQEAPRRCSWRHDAEDLLARLVSDLEERFGIRMRTILDQVESDGWDEDEETLGQDSDWSRAESFREAPRQPPRRVANRKAPDPESTAKGIYHSLARELHPDKTREESERARRTELMQNLTTAWTRRDLGALLGLLHAHGSEQAKANALEPDAAKACLDGLRANRDELRERVRLLRHRGLPDGAVDWLPLAKDERLFERTVRRQKAFPREEFDWIEPVKRLWSTPQGWERFLQEASRLDWEALA